MVFIYFDALEAYNIYVEELQIVECAVLIEYPNGEEKLFEKQFKIATTTELGTLRWTFLSPEFGKNEFETWFEEVLKEFPQGIKILVQWLDFSYLFEKNTVTQFFSMKHLLGDAINLEEIYYNITGEKKELRRSKDRVYGIKTVYRKLREKYAK